MDAACPVQKGRHQEGSQQNGRFLAGKNVCHHPVNSDSSKQGDEGIKNYIDIIITNTKDIKNRKDFNKYISFQVVPVRIIAFKEFFNAAFIRISEKIGEVFMRVIKK